MKILLALVTLVSVFVTPVLAQTVGKETLEGVDRVWVLVDALSPAAEGKLDAATLKGDVERKLRQAGIRVVEGEFDDLVLTGLPHLVVEAGVMEAQGLMVFSVSTSLERKVLLEESADAFTQELLAWADDPNSAYPPPPGTFFARTWSCAGSIATAPGSRFAEKAREILGNQIDVFLKDYLDVNSR